MKNREKNAFYQKRSLIFSHTCEKIITAFYHLKKDFETFEASCKNS